MPILLRLRKHRGSGVYYFVKVVSRSGFLRRCNFLFKEYDGRAKLNMWGRVGYETQSEP